MADGQSVPQGTPSFADVYSQLTSAMPQQAMAPTPVPMDMAKELMAVAGTGQQSVPGANQPYMVTPNLTNLIRMPQQPGKLQQDRPQQLLQGDAQQRAQIGQQNVANAFSNIVSGMANHFAQQKYEKNVATIKQYTDLIQKAQEARNILANDPTNEQARQMVASASNELANLTKGKEGQKNLKLLQKAIPNFTDPTKNGDEVKAAQSAQQQTKQDAALGLNDKTLAEKQVGQQNQQMTGGPNTTAQVAQGIQKQPLAAQNALSPMLQRALDNTPMQLQQNPAYVAQQLRNQKLQELVIAKLGPSVLNVQGRETVEEIKAKTQQYNAVAKDAVTMFKVNADNATKLQTTSQNNYVKWAGYEARYNSLAGLSANNPSMTGGAGKAAANIGLQIDKDIQTIQKTNSDRQKNIDTLENQLQFDHVVGTDSKGKPIYAPMYENKENPNDPGNARRREVEENIRNLKAQIATDDAHVKNLETTRDKYNDFATASGASQQPSGMDKLREQAGLGTSAPPVKASDFNPTGGYQQWMPMVDQIRQQIAPNVPSALAQTLLMTENRMGNPLADPQPANPSKKILQGGQGMFQMIPSNQSKYGITNWKDPADNTAGAMRMLGDSLTRSGGNIRKAVEDFAPKDSQGRPDQAYVNKVMTLYQQVSQAGGGGTSASGGAGASSTGSGGANQGGGSAVNTQPQPTSGGGGPDRQTFIGPKGAVTTSRFGGPTSFSSVGPHEDDTGGIDITTE